MSGVTLSDLRDLYFEEVGEHLGTIERTLIGLEARPDDPELLGSIFRAAHSIKGASATFGYEPIATFTHALEGLLDQLRNGARAFDAPLANLLLRAKDALSLLVDAAKGIEGDVGPVDEIRALLVEASGRAAPAPIVAPAPPPPAPTGESALWRVRFEPAAETFHSGLDPALLLRDLAQVGRVADVELDLSHLPPLDELEPEHCYLGWTVALDSAADEATLRDVFVFVDAASHVAIERVDSTAAAPPPSATTDPAEATLARVRAQTTAGAQVAPVVVGGAPTAAGPKAGGGTLRVAAEKIDQLVNLVGELVIAQSMIHDALNDASVGARQRLVEAVSVLERNTRELQDRIMAVRMVSVGTVFNRFPRLVRDLATTFGKEIALVIAGEETEIDKGMVEQIADPLTHLIRNSIDHGIERPDDREADGKPRGGTIRMSAYHQGGSVVIEVADDGRGLQTEKVRQKAIAVGLIRETDEPTSEELHALVFAAGFSTASQVSDVSGRGVGMDVVKRNVQAMGGTLSFTSEAGKGSLMRIRLPLTLAIMEGLTLRVGHQMFILPLASIVESFRPRAGQITTLLGQTEVVRVRGTSLPLVRLHEVLGIPDAVVEPTRGLVSVIETNGSRIGLLLDELCGQAQVVVKSLETNYRRVEAFVGATILGDGRVALILDPHVLARMAGASGADGMTRPRAVAPTRIQGPESGSSDKETIHGAE